VVELDLGRLQAFHNAMVAQEEANSRDAAGRGNHLRQEWAAYHRMLYRAHAQLAAEHAAKAVDLAEEAGT
jgi:hypothetical protein